MKYLVLIMAFALGGCRGDAGPDDYVSQEELVLDAAPPPIDSSIMEGEERLGIGVFYEGPATETVVVDGVQTHFYIYEGTVSVAPTDDERVEGASSDRFSLTGGPWWGAGVHWDTARDLSGWDELRVSLKSSSSGFESLRLGMLDGAGGEFSLPVSEYGFAADGQWHELIIPLGDFVAEGMDLSSVGAALVFVGGAGEAGEVLFVDGVFYSRGGVIQISIGL